MPHLMEISCGSSGGNFYFHGKLWHFIHEISHVDTHVYACRNEIIFELYHDDLVKKIKIKYLAS